MKQSIEDLGVNRPEFELLLVCARGRLEAGEEIRLTHLLQQALNWNYIERQSLQHGIFPLVYRILCTRRPGSVPEAVRARFRRTFQEHVLRCLLLSGRLVQVLDLFDSHGIRAIPFKGPVIARQLYGDMAYRQYCDLDILIQPDDLQRAGDLLLQNGFVSMHGSENAPEGAFLGEPRCHLSYFSQKGGVTVELHYNINYTYFSPRFSAEIFWDDLHTEEFEKRSVLTPARESMLFYLCVHGASHYWQRLGWVADVAELARDTDLDWEKLVAMAKELGCRKILYLGLFLAQGLLQAPVPAMMLLRGRELRHVQATARSIVSAWFRKPHPYLDKLKRRVFYVEITDNREDQADQLRQMALPPQRSGSIRTMRHGPFFVHLGFRLAQFAARQCYAAAARIQSWLGPR